MVLLANSIWDNNDVGEWDPKHGLSLSKVLECIASTQTYFGSSLDFKASPLPSDAPSQPNPDSEPEKSLDRQPSPEQESTPEAEQSIQQNSTLEHPSTPPDLTQMLQHLNTSLTDENRTRASLQTECHRVQDLLEQKSTPVVARRHELRPSFAHKALHWTCLSRCAEE